MPQAATLPTPSHTRRRIRADRRAVPIEERLSVLEAHWETLSPDLATRSDVRADVRGAENRLIMWILGAAAALAGFFLSNTARLDTRIDKLDAKFDAMMAELRSQRRAE